MLSQRGSRYPIWSARTILYISIPVVATTIVLVFWISHSSPFVEFQITLLVIAIVLFAFLTLGLYRGARLERPHRESPTYTPLGRTGQPSEAKAKPSSGSGWSFVGDLLRGVDLPHIDLHLSNGSAGGDDLVGCLMSIVAWIVIAIVAVVLLWVLAQVLWATLFVAIAVLYWVFYRALRVVFAWSRLCQGKLLRSMGYSLLYTVLYTGWIFGVIWISRLALGR